MDTVLALSNDSESDDVFDLDIRVLADGELDGVAAPCDTSNGCAPTCASSCVST